MVEPPGLFSTTTDTGIDSDIFCAMTRAWMSVAPPGGKGTTMRTGLPGSGKDCACSAPANPRSNARTASLMNSSRGLVYILRCMPARHPERIVCLTEETTETLYLLGEERRIVGISGYTVRPPQARREKPRVSAFLSAKTDRILELKPDLVLGFSDLQADISKDLGKAGLNVVIFTQRSVQEILNMILVLSSLVGANERGLQLVKRLEGNILKIRGASKSFKRKPKVYFEEWDEPMISGIRWVRELVGVAGGEDIFSELSLSHAASGRTIADPGEVVTRNPDVIIGSWCGKKFTPDRPAARAAWGGISPGQEHQLHQLRAAAPRQNRPPALTDGVRRIHTVLGAWARRQP